MNPWKVPGDVLPRLGYILERVYACDIRVYRSLFKQASDSAEHFCRRCEPHHHARDTVPHCLFLRYGLGGGDEMAAFFQHEKRSLLCVATDQVEDDIDLLFFQNLLELRFSIVDDPAGSDGVKVGLIRRRLP